MVGALALVAAFFFGMVAHTRYINWKCMRCDACRIEEGLNGKSTVLRVHRCSPRRFPYLG
jgi:hypothetical protein